MGCLSMCPCVANLHLSVCLSVCPCYRRDGALVTALQGMANTVTSTAWRELPETTRRRAAHLPW